MRVGVLWMLMVYLSDGEDTSCPVQEIISVSKLSIVSVSCPSFKANNMMLKYQLFFNDSCVSQINLDKNITPGYLFSSQFKVAATISGVYICRRVVIYPPPFIEDCHTTEVKVNDLFIGKQPTINATGPAANQNFPDRSPSVPEVVMWVGCGVLLVYSLSITCITIIIWRKLKGDDKDTNIYANTRPGKTRKPYKV